MSILQGSRLTCLLTFTLAALHKAKHRGQVCVPCLRPGNVTRLALIPFVTIEPDPGFPMVRIAEGYLCDDVTSPVDSHHQHRYLAFLSISQALQSLPLPFYQRAPLSLSLSLSLWLTEWLVHWL